MSRQTEEEVARKVKLQKLIDAGIDPYPAKFDRSHALASVISQFDDLLKEGAVITVAGRLKAFRGHGGLTFATIEDGTVPMQIAFHKDVLGENIYETIFADNAGHFPHDHSGLRPGLYQ